MTSSGGLADLGAADQALPKEADIRLEMAGLYGGADSGAGAVAQLNFVDQGASGRRNQLAETLNTRCWDRALFGIDVEQAVADCDAALRHNRKVAEYLDSRGLAHLRLGQNDQAIEDYDAALALDPKIAWSLYGRAASAKPGGGPQPPTAMPTSPHPRVWRPSCRTTPRPMAWTGEGPASASRRASEAELRGHFTGSYSILVGAQVCKLSRNPLAHSGAQASTSHALTSAGT